MSCVQYLQDYYVLNESPEDFEELLKMMNSFTRGFQTKDVNANVIITKCGSSRGHND